MRNWKTTKRFSDMLDISGRSDHLEGPELLLQPRDVSRSSSRSGSRTRAESAGPRSKIWDELADHRQPEVLRTPYSIPMEGVLVVDSNGNTETLYITTQTMGYFEFTFSTANGFDIFMAFLSNSLPFERIVKQWTPNNLVACASGCDSYDVETLQATRMKERVKSESFPERMRRKMVFVASRIGEREYHLCVKCVCCFSFRITNSFSCSLDRYTGLCMHV